MRQDAISRKTGFALLLTGLLNEPLVGLFAIMPFILRKDLHATVFQISIFTTLKPLMALLSFYWGARLTRYQSKIRENLIWAWLLARLPFFFFPFVDNIWYFTLSSALYLLFQRAGTPAQMEILKCNVPNGLRERFFSLSSALNYAEGILIGLILGKLMDSGGCQWKTLFFISALIGLIAIFVQMKVPLRKKEELPVPTQTGVNYLFQPWKDSFKLLKERPDFAHFQWGFMAGGLGLMLMIPAATLFYADELALDHTDMLISRLVCMGLGFVLSTPLWRRALSRLSIFQSTGWACLGFAFCPLLLLPAHYSITWVYLQFFIYGVAQAGSHLIWHLSGPLFAGPKNSSPFSTVNILAVGVRGVIIFLFGGLLCELLGAVAVLLLSALFSLSGFFYMLAKPGVKQAVEKY